MIPDRYAAFLEALRAHFRDKEIRPADLLKAAKENQVLGVALVALVPRANVLRIGKLFARMRGKSFGDCILDGSIDLHTKSWVYTVSPYAPKKPSKIEAAKADLAAALEIAEAPPYEQLSNEDLAELVGNLETGKEDKRRSDIIAKRQREADEAVQAAQRKLDRVRIAHDPDLLDVKEFLRKQNREQQKAMARASSDYHGDELQSGTPGWQAEEVKKAEEARTAGHHGTAQRIETEAAHKQRMQKPRPQWSMAELEEEKLYQQRKNTPGGSYAVTHSHSAISWGSNGLWTLDCQRQDRSDPEYTYPFDRNR
jgi:hypothetical protein